MQFVEWRTRRSGGAGVPEGLTNSERGAGLIFVEVSPR